MSKLKKRVIIAVILIVTIIPTPIFNAQIQVSAENSGCDFQVVGGTSGTDYEYKEEDNQLIILSNASITITMKDSDSTSTKDTILLKDGADVIIDGVNIESSAADSSAITVSPSSSALITLIGENTVISSSAQAGIGLTDNSSLTIDGSGSLFSKGGQNSPGVGGINGAKNTTLNIDNGTIETIGGQYAAGVGGGYQNNDITVNINGGYITATGGEYAAGIGTGYENSCGTITVSDGVIDATGGNYGAGIGSSYGVSGHPCSIIVNNGNINATGGYRGSGIGISHSSSLRGKSIKINGGNIIAQGGTYGAGIGFAGATTINGGDIEANGGKYAAGIGGSSLQAAGGTLTINDGNIDAQGGIYAAGIGGAYNGSAGNITVNGGYVKATGGNSGSGIGGGEYGHGGNVSINGGSVLAYGFDKKEYSGAGIGGGYRGSGGTTVINDGFVTAQGGTGAEDIGDGDRYVGSRTFDVTIKGGSVWAVGGSINGSTGPISKDGDSVYPLFVSSTENKTDLGTLANSIYVDKYEYNAKTVSSLTGSCEHNESFSSTYPDTSAIIYLPKDSNVTGIEMAGLPNGYADVKATSDFKAKINEVFWNVEQAGSFAIFKGTEGTDYTISDNTLTILNNADVHLTMNTHGTNANEKIVIADDAQATLRIKNLLIDNSGFDSEVIKLGSGSELDLIIEDNSTLTADANHAAISVPESTSMVISGTGGLVVKGGTNAPAIGGNTGLSSGAVNIKNGFVTANGGTDAEDIENVTIDGGSFWAVNDKINGMTGPVNSSGDKVYPLKIPSKNPLSGVSLLNNKITVNGLSYFARTISEREDNCEHGSNFPEDISALLYLPAGKTYNITVGSYTNGTAVVKPDSSTSSDNNTVYWTYNIKLNTNSKTVNTGSVYNLSVVFNPSYVSNKNITWSSSNKKIASVSNGKVSAKKEGTVYITAKSNFNTSKTAKAKITVVSPVKSIKVPQSKVYLTKGKTYTIPYVAYTSNNSTAKITWKSKNKKIATVSSTGKITARKKGTTTITGTAKNGKSVIVKIKVVKKAKALKSITIMNAPKSIKAGKSKMLKAKIKAASATNIKVTWSSSKKSVATVDKAGKLIAKKKGKTKITVKAGKQKKTMIIEVK